jgi:hypothetical protein
MTGLAVCSIVFLILLLATISVALSKARRNWLTSSITIVAVSFILTAVLGFILTNNLLELPNPILLTVIIVLAGAVFLELAQSFIVKEKAALLDIVFVLVGACLCLLARYVLH